MKGLLLSVAINLLVGAYLLWGYPRTVKRSFKGRPPPPAFALLARVIPPLGGVIIAASLAWLIYTLYSTQ